MGLMQVGNNDFILQSDDDLSTGDKISNFKVTKQSLKPVDFADFRDSGID